MCCIVGTIAGGECTSLSVAHTIDVLISNLINRKIYKNRSEWSIINLSHNKKNKIDSVKTDFFLDYFEKFPGIFFTYLEYKLETIIYQKQVSTLKFKNFTNIAPVRI